MRTSVASLATVLMLLAAALLTACGEGGAEPDAPPDGAASARELDLVLDFQPNAVHAGIYAAEASEDGNLEIRAPGASTDAPKLLRAGRADLAILDIHDLAIAREQGIELVGVAAIVQEPLAAVIAGDREAISEPSDLAGSTVGVSGLPSDDAVLDAVLADGELGREAVDRVTIGFDAVPQLLAGRIDAATAFWNAEGVTLAGRLRTREFRLGELSSVPSYPELVLVTTPELLASDRGAITTAVEAIDAGYRAVAADPDAGLDALATAVPELDREATEAQLDAVLPALGTTRELDRETLEQWAAWEAASGITDEPPAVKDAFDFSVAGAGAG